MNYKITFHGSFSWLSGAAIGMISTVFLSEVVLSSVTVGLGLVAGCGCAVFAVVAAFVLAAFDREAAAFCEELVLAVFWVGTVAACWVFFFNVVALLFGF
jgi:hypothetical protein